MLSRWNYTILSAVLLLYGANGRAQTAAPAPSYVPPPAWNAGPELAPGFVPAQPSAAAPGYAPAPGYGYPAAPAPAEPPYTDGSYFVPVQPAPNVDYFEDEEDMEGYGSGSGGGSGKSRAEGKESFKLVDPPRHETCRKWGNPLLNPTTFPDRGKCEFELDRKVDDGNASIDSLYDQVETYKLRKVIRGELKSRADARKYTVNFDSLRKSLSEASKEGCSCLD